MISSKEEIVDYLRSVPAWYMATVEDTPAGPAPHVRPFSFAELQDGQIVFCTSKAKDVYREMHANPNVELTAWKPGSARPSRSARIRTRSSRALASSG